MQYQKENGVIYGFQDLEIPAKFPNIWIKCDCCGANVDGTRSKGIFFLEKFETILNSVSNQKLISFLIRFAHLHSCDFEAQF